MLKANIIFSEKLAMLNLNERINEIKTLKKKQAETETSDEINQMRNKLATLQAEKESSIVLHEDEIQSYKFDLEHIQEDYKLLGTTKDELKSSIALHKKIYCPSINRRRILPWT